MTKKYSLLHIPTGFYFYASFNEGGDAIFSRHIGEYLINKASKSIFTFVELSTILEYIDKNLTKEKIPIFIDADKHFVFLEDRSELLLIEHTESI